MGARYDLLGFVLWGLFWGDLVWCLVWCGAMRCDLRKDLWGMS